MLGKMGFVGALASAAGLTCALTSVAWAQSEADFFKGRTVTYIVATAPGGGYDYYGRLVAEYMQRFFPGSTFIVRNMPGAGHIIGANFIYSSKPDGLTIGTFNTGLIYSQLIKADALKADLTQMSWIGKASTDPRAIVVSANTPIKTFEDLRTSKQVTFSTSGIGSAGYAETKVLSEILSLPIKLVTGYNGNDDQLAMRRGEIGGTINTVSSWEEFVRNGYGRYIAQIGGRDRGVPQLSTFVAGEDAKAVVALISSQGEIARLTAGPPGIPPARLQVLIAAYRSAMENSELQEKAAKGERPVEAAYGSEVQKMVSAALTQSPKIISILKEALSQTPTALKVTGPLAAVDDQGRKVTVNGPDGKPVVLEPSVSRTKITRAGKEASRDELKAGLDCEVSYAAGSSEPLIIACK